MAKKLPERRRRAQILKLSEAREALARCEEPGQAAVIAEQAKLEALRARAQAKLLKCATLAEALEARREAQQNERAWAEVGLRAEARQGELLPELKGRPKKGDPRVPLSKKQRERLRQLARLVPQLDAYMAEGHKVTRRGFMRWAQERNDKTRARARRAAAAYLHEGPKPMGAPNPRGFDPAPGKPLDPYDRAADGVLRVASELEKATRGDDLEDGGEENWPWARARSGALQELRDMAGRLAQHARDRREAKSGTE